MSTRVYKDELFAVVKPGNKPKRWFWDIYDQNESPLGQDRAKEDVNAYVWGVARSKARAEKRARKQLARIREQRARLAGERTVIR
jgi:hypothetical protein